MWFLLGGLLAALVVVGWSLRGAVEMTERRGVHPTPDRWPFAERPWVRVVSDRRLVWAWVLLLVGAVVLGTGSREDGVSVGMATALAAAAAMACACVSAALTSRWLSRRGLATRPPPGLASWAMSAGGAALGLVVGAALLDAWSRWGRS